jgi:hypothetical protein
MLPLCDKGAPGIPPSEPANLGDAWAWQDGRGQYEVASLSYHRGASTVDNEATNQAETDQRILTFDVSDDALERAASAEQNAFTLVYCTSPWYNCGLPQ